LADFYGLECTLTPFVDVHKVDHVNGVKKQAFVCPNQLRIDYQAFRSGSMDEEVENILCMHNKVRTKEEIDVEHQKCRGHS